MKKPSHFKKYKFDDFPAEYYLKTYLGSRALIVGCGSCSDLICVWLEGDIFVKDFYVGDLQASKEEIDRAYNLLCKKTGGGKPIRQRVIPRRNEVPSAYRPDRMPPAPPRYPEYDAGCNCDLCTEERERQAQDTEGVCPPSYVYEEVEYHDDLDVEPEEQEEASDVLSQMERLQQIRQFYTSRPVFMGDIVNWRITNEHNE